MECDAPDITRLHLLFSIIIRIKGERGPFAQKNFGKPGTYHVIWILLSSQLLNFPTCLFQLPVFQRDGDAHETHENQPFKSDKSEREFYKD